MDTQSLGRKENVDAIEFMRQLNSTVFQYFPGVMMIAEESTAWALVTKPPYTGGLGFSYKWEHGLDERLFALYEYGLGIQKVPSKSYNLLPDVRFLGKLYTCTLP